MLWNNKIFLFKISIRFIKLDLISKIISKNGRNNNNIVYKNIINRKMDQKNGINSESSVKIQLFNI